MFVSGNFQYSEVSKCLKKDHSSTIPSKLHQGFSQGNCVKGKGPGRAIFSLLTSMLDIL
jgi:hypothetical protein